MSKGARNRKKRRAAEQNASGNVTAEVVVEELLQLEDLAAFEELLERQPSLADPSLLAWFDRVAQDQHFGAMFASLGRLLRDARTNPSRAWAAYDGRRAEAKVGADRAQDLQQQIGRALDGREFDEVGALVDEAIPLAAAAGLGLVVGRLEDQRGQALFQSAGPNRVDRIEGAIASFRQAIALTTDADARAGSLMHLGLALGERVLGDHADNLDAAVDAVGSAIDLLTDSSPAWLWSIIRTNLAWSLLRRERGDRISDLRRAERLCEEALTYRSLERDPGDWAHTQLNLGEVRARLLELGDGELEAVEQTYLAVVDAAAELEPWLVGAAEFRIGRLQRQKAHRTPQELVELHQSGHDDAALVDATLLDSAYKHLKEAARLAPADHDPIRRGHTLSEFSAAAQELGFDTEAIEAAQGALGLLTPESDLRGCAAVGMRLGSMLCARGDYTEAADAFRTAVRAADLAFFSRLDTEGRELDIRSAGNVYRWASFAIAATGDPLDAALVLETGSARELRRRVTSMSLTTELSAVPATLRDEYEHCASLLATAPFGAMSRDAARRLEEATTAIRAVPGMASFAAAATPTDLLAATEAGWPLVYLNPTPFGTVILAVVDDGGAARVEAALLTTTSTEVFNRLSLGALAAEPEATDAPAGSYILGIGAAGDAEVEDHLDLILPWLGEALIEPITRLNALNGADGLTIVPYGPLNAAPLHAAVWSGPTRLLDSVAVRYSPSAAVVAAALERHRTPTATAPRFVAVADPFGDLLSAQPEAEHVAALFEQSRTAAGMDATGVFLKQHAPAPSHLHLACHAYGGLFDETETALLLADGATSLLEISELQLSCRVCVASACQTALSSMTSLPQEGLSLATVVLAAGSASAIASLWPVDDGATAILMILLYQHMISNSLRPPEALRRAQLALQRLTFRDLQTLLNTYPDLRAGLRIGGHLPADPADSAETPFDHPFLWAGFVAVGV